MVSAVFIAGSIPFVVLGFAHIAYSISDSTRPARIVPREPELIESMKAGRLVITRQTTVWRAWIGFNISHGMGVFLFGLVVLYAALFGFEANLSAMPALFYASPLVAAVYLILSLKYWFRIPAIGTGIGAVFLTAGVVWLLIGA
ncbi:MAG: hypothetical protein O7I42_21970 [Alphaproteobacteria bacterium]|nr:hypothetical protein [Alphaproteobacteria bacterium]